jgi:hypothetical protein
LWLVFAVLWIAIAVATTWKQFVYFQPTAPGKPDFLDTTEICAQSTTAEACANLLKAAGKNPFNAWDLKHVVSDGATREALRARTPFTFLV